MFTEQQLAMYLHAMDHVHEPFAVPPAQMIGFVAARNQLVIALQALRAEKAAEAEAKAAEAKEPSA